MAALARTASSIRNLLQVVAAGLMTCATSAGAKTVTVPGDFPTVQAVVAVAALQGIDSVLVSAHAEPSPLVLNRTLTLIGVPDPLGTLPTLPETIIYESYCRFVGFRFSGRIENWKSTEFQRCEINAGFFSMGHGNAPATVGFLKCVIRGQPAAMSMIHYVTIDSCEVHGRIALEYPSDGGLVIRNSTLTGPGFSAVTFDGSSNCVIENTAIRGFDSGVWANSDDGIFTIKGCLIEDCAGIAIESRRGAGITDNRIRNCGDGIVVDEGGAKVARNVILGSGFDGIRFHGEDGAIEGNVVGRSGRFGIFVDLPAPTFGITVRGNTSYGSGRSGLAIFSENEPASRFENNISFGSGEFGLLVEGTPIPLLSCNDWFANSLGATSGISPSTSDLAIDPDFCNLIEDDVHLIAGSPLLDAVGCGLIGALGQGCTTTATLDARLTAERLLDGVRLRWYWATSTAIALERAEALAGPWATSAAELSRDADATIAFDREALPGRAYWYRLRAFDRGGWESFGEPVFVPAASAAGFQLLGVTPNPGHGPLRVTFSLPRAATVELDVFDILGRHVATLARGPHAAGVHTAEWLGREGAEPAHPGIYLVRYRHPDGRQARRVVLAR